MTLQKRRLGRGLESLISEAVDVDAATGLEGLRNVALEALKPGPFNPRNKF
ncbi:MAG: chromosome partitioning protein ParB, partial [Proteobacteria bacterium]|nr:chromosome partitioning protein ParB [Pseudomonadota bacterium]